MSAITRFLRLFNYSAFEASEPASPKPGAELDAEFNALKVTTDDIIGALEMIQRDDGQLANGSVTRDALNVNVAMGINAPKAWAAFTPYTVRDSVIVSGAWYWCTVSHTSQSAFNPDDGNWQFIAGFTITTGLPDASTMVGLDLLQILADKSGYRGIAVASLRPTLGLPATPSTTIAQYLRNDGTGKYAEADVSQMRTDMDIFYPDVSALSGGEILRLRTDKTGYDLIDPTTVFPVADAGDIKMTARTTAPAGWSFCDGGTLSRTGDGAVLFSAIGTTYGVGDGSTTFNKPDYRGRGPIGAGTGTGLTARTLGAKGGEEAHALTAGENGPHTHGYSGNTSDQSASHTHGFTGSVANGVDAGDLGSAPNTGAPPAAGGTGGASNGHTHSYSGSTDGGGAIGTAHNNMQPWAAVNFLIKL